MALQPSLGRVPFDQYERERELLMLFLYVNKVNIDYHIIVFTADYIENIGFFC